MSEFLPKEVLEGLELARRQAARRKAKMRVRVGDDVFTILRYWDNGFALDAEEAPNLRGLVDLYEGDRHVSQCLIVTSAEESGERVFEFKWETAASKRAPLDYAKAENAPAALIERLM